MKKKKRAPWTPTEWIVLAIFFLSLTPYLWDFLSSAYGVAAMPAEWQKLLVTQGLATPVAAGAMMTQVMLRIRSKFHAL